VTDVVVIGAGGAGLAAAVSAAEKGANVIVLEKSHKAGGATVFAEGLVAAESPVQERLGIFVTTDELFKNHMYFNHWTLNARLVRALLDISGDSIGWLEKKGVVFKIRQMGRPPRTSDKKIPPSPLSELPAVFHVPEHWGSGVVHALQAACKELGVKVFYEARARQILKGRTDAVSGISVLSKGKETIIKTKTVIIATGGYGANKRLIKKYCPFYDTRNFERLMVKHSHPGDRFRWVKKIHNGDGLMMAFDAGAASDGLGILLLNGPNFVAFNHAWMLAMNASTLWVNKYGERFMQEGVGPFQSDNGTMRQPDQTTYSLFDDAFKQEVVKAGFGFVSGGLYSHDASKIDDDLKHAIANDTVKISPSWDKIARWIGAEPGTLKATIDEYNSFCDKGHDDLFAKNSMFLRPLRQPPFYACKSHPAFLVTIGGIKTNHCMEVLDKKDQPIKGLYAAGICTGGWSGPTYNMALAGAGCGFSTYGGRIAGQNAADYVEKQVGHIIPQV
jgi:fumarate reductase flavoprotein subunit